MRILDRYVLRELAAPFLFGVAAFATVFIAGNLLFKFARLVTEQGMPLGDALLVFLYWLPGYLVLTFPMATLLATLLAFGRMSGDGETTAMRAGGVSFRRVMIPVIAAGVGISLFTIAFNELVVPRSTRAAEDLLARAAKQASGTQQHVLVRALEQGEIRNLIYAREFNRARGELRDVTYVQYTAGEPVLVIQGERAEWRGAKWEFYGGFLQHLDPYRKSTLIIRKDHPLRFDLGHDPEDIALRRREPEELTWRELGDYLARLAKEGVPAPELRVQWHHKLSVPFASLIFALIGAPLGLRSPRTGSALGLGLSVLIIFIYYVIWNYLGILAGRGAFPALWAAWTPNIIGVAIGGALVRRAAR
ncbi:MAG: LptF/LptG family permease [Armatimonadota bacterium]|nr:MAG: LptF/LptG family permease [Armatimonadota bacterium]